MTLYADQPQDDNANNEPVEGLAEFDEAADYKIELSTGRVIDVGEVFRPQGRLFEQSLSEQLKIPRSPLIRVNHSDSKQPALLASRRGKVLHGPFASFAKNGSPIAYVSYEKGERSTTLLTWDEVHRPLVFAQYTGRRATWLSMSFPWVLRSVQGRSTCGFCRNGKGASCRRRMWSHPMRRRSRFNIETVNLMVRRPKNSTWRIRSWRDLKLGLIAMSSI